MGWVLGVWLVDLFGLVWGFFVRVLGGFFVCLRLRNQLDRSFLQFSEMIG